MTTLIPHIILALIYLQYKLRLVIETRFQSQVHQDFYVENPNGKNHEICYLLLNKFTFKEVLQHLKEATTSEFYQMQLIGCINTPKTGYNLSKKIMYSPTPPYHP